MLKARSAVYSMKSYHPPLGNRGGLRLDFNENTVGCSPRVLGTLAHDRWRAVGALSGAGTQSNV